MFVVPLVNNHKPCSPIAAARLSERLGQKWPTPLAHQAHRSPAHHKLKGPLLHLVEMRQRVHKLWSSQTFRFETASGLRFRVSGLYMLVDQGSTSAAAKIRGGNGHRRQGTARWCRGGSMYRETAAGHPRTNPGPTPLKTWGGGGGVKPIRHEAQTKCPGQGFGFT